MKCCVYLLGVLSIISLEVSKKRSELDVCFANGQLSLGYTVKVRCNRTQCRHITFFLLQSFSVHRVLSLRMNEMRKGFWGQIYLPLKEEFSGSWNSLWEDRLISRTRDGAHNIETSLGNCQKFGYIRHKVSFLMSIVWLFKQVKWSN